MNNEVVKPVMNFDQQLEYLTEGGVERTLELFEIVKATPGTPKSASIFKVCDMKESDFERALEVLIVLGFVKRSKYKLAEERIYFSPEASSDEFALKEKIVQLLVTLAGGREEKNDLKTASSIMSKSGLLINFEEIKSKKINKGRIRKQREEVFRRSEKNLIINHAHIYREQLNKMWWVSEVLTEQVFGKLCCDVLCKVDGGDFWVTFFQCFRLEASEYYRDVEKEDCWFCYEEAARTITEIAENLENQEDFKEKLCIQLFKNALIDDMEAYKSYSIPVMRLA